MHKKRIMVDMSCTLIHHGHIRLIKKASEYGDVIIGLTTDDEVFSKKGFKPELSYQYRKEVLEALSAVCEVVPVPWVVDDKVLEANQIDLLVHGDDNSNSINEEKIKIFDRTKGISSSQLRNNALRAITEVNNQKLMLTPGPAVVLYENLENIRPLFGRGDDEYTYMSEEVIKWIKVLSGQDEVIMAQGSATFALELAAHSFISGKVLLVSTGYYSDRLLKLLPVGCNISTCKYKDLDNINEKFDWILCAYTETSIAFKVDLVKVKTKAEECSAKLYVDATGSIGLEENHDLADVMAFSSCKGLFGLTGACFVAYKDGLNYKSTDHFYFNLDTQANKMTTGPYHAIASLYGVMKNHHVFKKRVENSKKLTLEKWHDIVREDNQPLLCTYLEGQIIPNDEKVVLYSPRSSLSGSVICHFGEIHQDVLDIDKRIKVSC